MRRFAAFLTSVLLTASSSAPAFASEANTDPVTPAEAREARPVVVWGTLTPGGEDSSGVGLHKPSPSDGKLHARALELDATLRDAVQDLGYTLDVADPGPAAEHARELDMIERASRTSAAHGRPIDDGTWLVSPRLEALSSDAYLLRIVVVPPKGKQLRVRVERVSGADVSARGLVLLRDLLATAPLTTPEVTKRPDTSAAFGIMSPQHSPGRAVLAANAGLFGAFMAFSMQRASGSDDPRVLYPLLTLGTGLGVGSALLVSEEWNVSTGDAWTLAGAAWWGAASGIFLANGRAALPLTDRYAWGVGGGLIGLGLATFSLTRSRADEGDAALVHSGAALGLGVGSLTELFHYGTLERSTNTGAGYGTAAGLLASGVLATFVEVAPSRVLLVDLGAGIGAAAGAAAGSPLIFEDVTPTKARGFLAATVAGTLIGGGTALWLTRGRFRPVQSRTALPVVPFGGTIGASQTRTGSVPAYGIGVRGTF